MRVFIGMETSGQLRRRFRANGHHVISCDLLPAEDNSPCHVIGDVFATLSELAAIGWIPDFGVFHPECTYHTLSAAWAFADPDYDRYPGVGYHQRVKPGTLVGAKRRAARSDGRRGRKRKPISNVSGSYLSARLWKIRSAPFRPVSDTSRRISSNRTNSETMPARRHAYGHGMQTVSRYRLLCHADDTCRQRFDRTASFVGRTSPTTDRTG